MELESYLPKFLRGPSTVITPITVGLSGSRVYRVEVRREVYVLKVFAPEMVARWHTQLPILMAAAEAGLAPRLLHVDEERFATVSVFVDDRSFPTLFANPATHALAARRLGRTLRQVHALPLPANAEAIDPRAFIRPVWEALVDFPLPSFVRETVETLLAQDPPAAERAAVLSHNDINPTNLVFDGERLVLFDWDMAGANDPYYDLATVAVFMRMNDATCARVIAAYDDDAEPAPLTSSFQYHRRLVSVLTGVMFMSLAHAAGYAGDASDERAAPLLGDVYARMRAGELDLASGAGRFELGLALLRTGAAATSR